MASDPVPQTHQHVALFDGACGMCSGFVSFARARGRGGVVSWVANQSDQGQDWLQRIGMAGSANGPDTIVVVADVHLPEQRTLVRSDAALFLFGTLDRPWRWLRMLRWVPRFFRDWVYRVIANNRLRISRWLGKAPAEGGACALPPARRK